MRKQENTERGAKIAAPPGAGQPPETLNPRHGTRAQAGAQDGCRVRFAACSKP